MRPLIILFLSLCQISLCDPIKKQPKCGGGDPCIFMGRDEGWIGYEEPKGPKPYPPKTDSWKRNDTTILLTIASFRDKLCPVTLFNLFSKALNPSRVFVAVVQQNIAEEDVDCEEEYCRLITKHTGSKRCLYTQNIHMNRVNAKDAQGPTWARALGSKMVGDQEFCMQTDSHMDFVPEWDRHMLEMWGLLQNEYGVLSTYVAGDEQYQHNVDGKPGLNGLHEVPHLCMVTFHGAYGMVRNWGTKCARSLPHPKLTNIVWGAGLSFSKCHAEKKVPYDPHTPGIFDGEEFSRGLRLWTYGYDTYTPHRVFIVHNYHVSQSDPKHSQWAYNSRETNVDASVVRLRTIFGMPGGEQDATKNLAVVRSKYGRGDRRTLEQAIAFSGIDTKNQKTLFNGCGNLEFVPFQEHVLGAEYIPRFDETEAPLDEPDPGSIYFDPLTAKKYSAEHFVNGKYIGDISHTVISYSSSSKDASASSSRNSVQKASIEKSVNHWSKPNVRQKILDEYAMLLQVENEAKSELDSTGHPQLILFSIFFLVCFLCWLCGHRCHVGKKHTLGSFVESVKTV